MPEILAKPKKNKVTVSFFFNKQHRTDIYKKSNKVHQFWKLEGIEVWWIWQKEIVLNKIQKVQILIEKNIK